MRRVLVVDDEPKILRLVASMLSENGLEVATRGTTAEARRVLDEEIFDLVVTDVRLPDGSGVEILEHARSVSPSTQIILITAYGTVSEAVHAMKVGAFDYLQKPFEMEALRCLAARALEHSRMREEISMLRAGRRKEQRGLRLIGEAPAMQEIRRMIAQVAQSPATVLILGESGTGKELVAEALHNESGRRDQPFVKVNCLALPSELIESELFGHVRGAFTGAQAARKGWFELAEGGTLLLDEIADLPLQLQGKLLRVLEERTIARVGSSRQVPVDVRILASCNVDLLERVSQGRFREDLYYRLAVFPIRLPPLRERRGDVAALAGSLLARIAARSSAAPPAIDEAALALLAEYDWPGNVRELRNVLERAVVLSGGGPITGDHLPREMLASPGASGSDRPGGLQARTEHFQVELILDTLEDVGWVKKDAAERLGLSPRALTHYVNKYDLDRRRKTS